MSAERGSTTDDEARGVGMGRCMKREAMINTGEDGYLLEDVPHLSHYIPHLPRASQGASILDVLGLGKRPFSDIVTDNILSKIFTWMRQMHVQVYFEGGKVGACIVTCGSLCPGINTVIRELVCGLHHMYGVAKVIGIQGGYKGFQCLGTAVTLTPQKVNDIHKCGGSILGTGHDAADTVAIVDCIQQHGINQLYVIGGLGTMRDAASIYEEIEKQCLNVSVVGIPGTIDNDIGVIDKSFGFDSAIQEAQKAIRAAHVEAESGENGVGLVKLMGRNSGFIAMYATLASRDVDCCLIPESLFYLEGKGGLFEFMEQRLRQDGHMVMVVAEGAGQGLVPASFSDVGIWLNDKIKEHFAKKKIVLNLKYIDPTYMIGAIPSNAADNVYCTLLAHSAIHGAMAGYTGFAVGPVNGKHAHIPIHTLIEKQRQVCLADRMWARLLSSTNQPSFRV
ncbi:ATP-dependent 6-phosphofructokinase 5 [Nymphaea thermarum]|nr:ATP-dependent 6-phosphofructokinase 5 [Nymphaea thermarum]